MTRGRALRIAVTVILIGVIAAIWGVHGLALYLAIKLVGVVLLGVLWVIRRRLAR